MKKYISIDLSSRTGYSIIYVDKMKIQSIEYDKIDFKEITPIVEDYDKKDVINHPGDFLLFVEIVIKNIMDVLRKDLDCQYIIIEQTNKGRNRWTQKLLEWLHYELMMQLKLNGILNKVKYINTMSWRNILNIKLTKEQKAENRKLRKERKRLKEAKLSTRHLKYLVNPKHLAISFVKEHFDIELKMNENDIAESICIGTAFLVKEKIIIL